MDIETLAETVEDMILQLSYPGFERRSLKLGLPDLVNKAPAKVFAQALKHESVLVRLAALRWFGERPGIAKINARGILACLSDSDEWVRVEALLCIERFGELDDKDAEAIAALLTDQYIDVKKGAAKALGKIGNRSEPVLAALRQAAESPDTEFRWKVEKSLRKLGAYTA